MLKPEDTQIANCQEFYQHLYSQIGFRGQEMSRAQLETVLSSLRQAVTTLNAEFHRGQVAQSQVEAQDAHLIKFRPSLCPTEATYELIDDFISDNMLEETQGKYVITLLKLMVDAGCFAEPSQVRPDDQQAASASPASHQAQGASRD